MFCKCSASVQTIQNKWTSLAHLFIIFFGRNPDEMAENHFKESEDMTLFQQEYWHFIVENIS